MVYGSGLVTGFSTLVSDLYLIFFGL